MMRDLGNCLAVLLLFSMFPVVAGEVIHLNLGTGDIQGVALEERTAWVKLTPEASEDFMRLTQANEGKWLEIAVEGIPAMKVHIFSSIDSGIVQISRPTPELRERLSQIKSQASVSR